MVHFQSNPKLWRNVCLALAVVILLAIVSCSDQSTQVATNQPAKQPAKAAASGPAKKPAAAKPATAPAKPASAKPAAAPAKAAQPAPMVTVPKGTAITATVDQTLASNKTHKGDTFEARLSTPVKVDGKVVIPKGTEVTGKVVTVKKNELKVALASVKLHGKSYDLATDSRKPSDKIQVKNAKASDKDKASKDKKDKDAKLPAQTQLTFKLSKPITVPATKG